MKTMLNLDYLETRNALSALNEDRLTVSVNGKRVILYGDVTRTISSQSFSSIIVHKSENP